MFTLGQGSYQQSHHLESVLGSTIASPQLLTSGYSSCYMLGWILAPAVTALHRLHHRGLALSPVLGHLMQLEKSHGLLLLSLWVRVLSDPPSTHLCSNMASEEDRSIGGRTGISSRLGLVPTVPACLLFTK